MQWFSKKYDILFQMALTYAFDFISFGLMREKQRFLLMEFVSFSLFS